jgi:hypothetical protein
MNTVISLPGFCVSFSRLENPIYIRFHPWVRRAENILGYKDTQKRVFEKK